MWHGVAKTSVRRHWAIANARRTAEDKRLRREQGAMERWRRGHQEGG